MEIILPDKKYLGPCFGIRRAVEKCLSLKKDNFVIYGQLAHSAALCIELERSGLEIVGGIEDIKGGKVVIRPHGILKNDLDFLRKSGVFLVDLTCPFVKKLLDKAVEFEKNGYRVVIIGDKNHSEIKNVCSFLQKPLVIDRKDEVREIDPDKKIAVLTQTTQTLKKINELLPLIKRRRKEIVFISTRCDETDERQKEAKKISEKADLVLVVGDKMSKNANNLVKVAREKTRAKLVQNARGLAKILKNMHYISNLKVGVIASASTPAFVVSDIIKCLKEKKF
ncbi:4-hydroxy-3-methylbut-2-enyl diphosphate reductase [Candidatus Falkowbacteria bacterium]|nr:4-hydroxy-3-methylbut-2-enyl diphosphate reductase [Candidatus Falkowbacteria bacterium]